MSMKYLSAVLIGAAMFMCVNSDAQLASSGNAPKAAKVSAKKDTNNVEIRRKRVEEMRRLRQQNKATSGSRMMRDEGMTSAMRNRIRMMRDERDTTGRPPMMRGDRMTSGMPPMMRGDRMTTGMRPMMRRGERNTTGSRQMSPEMAKMREEMEKTRAKMEALSEADKTKLRSLHGQERTDFLKSKGIEMPQRSNRRMPMGPGPAMMPRGEGQVPPPPPPTEKAE